MRRKQFWKITLASLLSAVLTGCLMSSPTGEVRWTDSPEAVDRAMNSVVALVEQTPDGPTNPYCTAFFVGPRTLATAHHCVEVDEMVVVEVMPGVTITMPNPNAPSTIGREIFFVDHRTHDSIIENFYNMDPDLSLRRATVVQINPQRDIALLRLADDEDASHYHFPIAIRLPHQGARIYEIGMPQGQFWLLTEGIVSALRLSPDGHTTLIHDGHVSPGASGGPVLNNRGQIVGVTVSFANGRFYIGNATTSLELLDLMQKPLVRLGTPTMHFVAKPKAVLEVDVCENQSCPLPS